MKRISKMLFIAATVAITSQLYLNFIIDGFRVSTAVILFPILLVTYSKELSSFGTGVVTGLMVFLVRISILLIRGSSFIGSLAIVYPASMFYVFYGLKFKICIKNRYVIDYNKIIFAILMCDFVSNILEVGIRLKFVFSANDFNFYLILFFIAMTRSTIAYIILLIIKQYKNLLTKEEHERRYQNIVFLISDLKSEIYFMRKNMDNIENVMSNAYVLYESLSLSDLSNNTKTLSLNITKDIHELKKDYIRVIGGIESALTDKLDIEHMSFKDILYILRENTYRALTNVKKPINLNFNYDNDFTTNKHFQLMSILSNLVNNAIEAIEILGTNGEIKIIQGVKDDNYIFYIIDNGAGISQDNVEYIFDPGFSTKYNYKTGDIYRGVGLTNVRYLVEEFFNGSITVASRQSVGSTFEVIIPKISLGE